MNIVGLQVYRLRKSSVRINAKPRLSLRLWPQVTGFVRKRPVMQLYSQRPHRFERRRHLHVQKVVFREAGRDHALLELEKVRGRWLQDFADLSTLRGI